MHKFEAIPVVVGDAMYYAISAPYGRYEGFDPVIDGIGLLERRGHLVVYATKKKAEKAIEEIKNAPSPSGAA